MMITDLETETDELMTKAAKSRCEIEATSDFPELVSKMTEDYRKLLGENSNRLGKDLFYNDFLEGPFFLKHPVAPINCVGENNL